MELFALLSSSWEVRQSLGCDTHKKFSSLGQLKQKQGVNNVRSRYRWKSFCLQTNRGFEAMIIFFSLLLNPFRP